MFTLRSLMLWMALAAFVVTVGDTQASNSLSLAVAGSNQNIARGQSIELAAANKKGFYPGSIVVLPEDGREMYFQALDKARRNIRIDICVLEDPLILEHVKQAITRGVNVRVIVDQGKYQDLVSEQANLFSFVTEVGGQLHLSNPIFPRSFPKIILIDSQYAIVGSACLDTTTFLQYRSITAVNKAKPLAHWTRVYRI